MIVGLVRSLRVKRCLSWSAINTRGVIGGILVYQNSRVMKLVGLEMRAFSISCRFKNCEDGVVLVFISVYGQVCRREKKNLQDKLGATRGLRSDPWCVNRDFNMISFLGEHSRGGGLSLAMRRFLDLIEELELRDISLRGVLSLGGVD